MKHSIVRYLAEQKQHISTVLSDFARTKIDDFAATGRWGPDVLERLVEFSTRGKMIRGALVLLGDSLCDAEPLARPRADALRAAAAMELLQSFLLIHDDIIDQDVTRRGGASIYAQYAAMPRSHSDGSHSSSAVNEMTDIDRRFGEAMGICAGDIAMLLAFELLSRLECDATVRNLVLATCAREIQRVGVAQMNDVYHGFSSHAATEEEILTLYRFKTGRYTFSLPLLAGASLRGIGESDKGNLSLFGEYAGTLFQIKDDDLGIWGTEAETGKPLGSDIAEGKQTLHRLYLLSSFSASERRQVESLFGNKNSAAVEEVRVLLTKCGAQRHVQEVMEQQARLARTAVDSMKSISSRGREMLMDLVDYNLERRS